MCVCVRVRSCRGRAYPISGYLTHLGDDASRGLLEFGEGRPLGPRGMRWLLIQVRARLSLPPGRRCNPFSAPHAPSLLVAQRRLLPSSPAYLGGARPLQRRS